MKSVMKSAAMLLVVCILFCLAGCASAEKTWSAKYDDEILPIGVYICYLQNETNEAQGLVEDSEKPLLKQTIDGQKAEDWIRNEARKDVNFYFAVQKLMKERNLSLDEEDLQDAESTASSYWAQVSQSMSEYGIAYESFKKIILMQYQLNKIFDSMYLSGGDKEVPESEIKEYFESNYLKYQYALSYMYSYDDEGNYNLLTEEEQTQVEESIQEKLDLYNAGKLSVEDLEKEFADEKYRTYLEGNEDTSFSFQSAVDKMDESSDIGTIVKDLEIGKASVSNTGSGFLYIFIKEDIKDETDTYLTDETKKNTLISELKGEEFSEFVKAQAEELDDAITYNTSLMNSQKISKFLS